MEMVLLGFCLMSFTLSSIIVAFEIAKDGTRHKRGNYSVLKNEQTISHKKNTPIDSKKRNLFRKESKNKNSQKNLLNSLKIQLEELGYVTLEQQLGFVNWALNSKRNSLDEIKPQEFNYLFGIIQRYTKAS